ncbi:MAG: RagB/SusD family nutrient uptake outer membrane protein [Tannerellaceae bacterium]|nr:RagB/SusD family nutrient uptake outer membrane protein [Tannerellaceae bacterium]
MNKITLIFLLFIFSIPLYAQVPQAINYQAIVRDDKGKVLVNTPISVKLAILRGTLSGTVVYEETHKATSGSTGVVNLKIGEGTAVTGRFNAIDWSQSPYFVKFSMDTQGGTSYTEVATTQLLSIPYALYAERAGTVDDYPSGNDSTYDFMVATTSSSDGDLFAGTNPVYSLAMMGTIAFNVMYLNSENQEVDFRFEGLPDGAIVTEDGNGSGKYGRFFSISVVNLPEDGRKYACAPILSNKQGVTKRYPFIYTEKDTGSILPTPAPGDEEMIEMGKRILSGYNLLKNRNISRDKAFMEKEVIPEFGIFATKTYTPASAPVADLWDECYRLVAPADSFICYLADRSDLSATLQKQLALVYFVRGYGNLKLTEWFNQVRYPECKDLENIPADIPFKARAEILVKITEDLEAALAHFTESTDYISKMDIEKRLVEAYLLAKEWSMVINRSYETNTPVFAFYKNVAEWEKGYRNGIITLMDWVTEYMTDYYEDDFQGNLLLNILRYTGGYFGWSAGEAYKALLPIPQKELDLNPDVTQNPGYE